MNSTLTANEILAIPAMEPERLFGTPEAIHDMYRALARRWHPDNPEGNQDVFAHIGSLLARAKHLKDIGLWHAPGLFEFTADGKTYRVRYLRSFDFELGKVLIGKTLLTYVIANEFADLVANGRKVIGNLNYPDHKTRETMALYQPRVVGVHQTSTHIVVTIEKPADLIRFRDLLDHLGGKLPPAHVAWIVSRMLNHASYLEWAKLSHHDLSLDSLFIVPAEHTVSLLGGWWYAADVGKNLKGAVLPTRTLNNAPSELLSRKQASLRTDPEFVRLTARELLGDASGVRLMTDPDLPKPMVNWLRMSGSGSALKDYTEWREKILPASFGPRKFVKFPITAKDVYTELES